MNIKGQGYSTFSNFFFLETAWPIECKFYVEPPWDGKMRICTTSPSHITKMVVMPIYGKNFKNLLRNQRPITLKVGMLHRVLKYYQVYSDDDPGLTLTYFTARSNLLPYAFVWVKGKTMIFEKLL